MPRRNFILGIAILLATGALAIAGASYWIATEPIRHPSPTGYRANPVNPVPVAATGTLLRPLSEFKQPCPDFKEPTADQYKKGWTVYSRPDLCFSLAYPPGWGTIEDERGVEIMRIENFNRTTTFEGELFYAIVGVYLESLDEITKGLFPQVDEKALTAALAIGKPYCYVYQTPATGYTDCYQLGASGNYYTVLHTMDIEKFDLDLIKQIEATVKVW